MGYRPGEERGRTTFRFQPEPTAELRMTRVSAIIPPERPFEVNYAGAEGKVVTFEIEPRFVADVVRRAGIVPLQLEQVPPPTVPHQSAGRSTVLVAHTRNRTAVAVGLVIL